MNVLPPGAVRPTYIFAIQEFNETTNTPEQSRTPPIDISLADTPDPRYPRRLEKTNNGRNRETLRNSRTRDFYRIKS